MLADPPLTILTIFLVVCRSSTSLDSECSVLKQCLASGLFRSRSNIQLSWLNCQERTCNVLGPIAAIVSWVFLTSFSLHTRAASIHVLPGKWESCWNEAWRSKTSCEGSNLRQRNMNSEEKMVRLYWSRLYMP